MSVWVRQVIARRTGQIDDGCARTARTHGKRSGLDRTYFPFLQADGENERAPSALGNTIQIDRYKRGVILSPV